MWRPLQGEQGQDMSEYALLMGLIVILAIVAVSLLGESISGVLSSITSSLASALAG
jgi:Flp pilus assembly pilin Flp